MVLTRRGLLGWAAALVASLPQATALASLARAASLAELVARSERAILGTALDAESRWEHVGRRKRIVTYTRVRVDEALGGAGQDTELVLRTLGGQVGKIGQVVHGEAVLVIGEPAILFVGRDHDGTARVAEMAQGHYPVRTAKDGSRRVFPSPRLSELSGSPDAAVTKLVGRRLEEALGLVRRAWRDAR